MDYNGLYSHGFAVNMISHFSDLHQQGSLLNLLKASHKQSYNNGLEISIVHNFYIFVIYLFMCVDRSHPCFSTHVKVTGQLWKWILFLYHMVTSNWHETLI